MVSVGRHPNIKLLAYSEVESVSGYVGNYQVKVRRKPRYIDESKCTGCGNCASVCPVDVSNEFDHGLSQRKAAYRFSAQAAPGAFAIDKKGVAPCRAACPTDQRAMGYVTGHNAQWIGAAFVALMVFLLLGGVAILTRWNVVAQKVGTNLIPQIGTALMTTYLLPFEAVSLLLLAALVGAIVIARE